MSRDVWADWAPGNLGWTLNPVLLSNDLTCISCLERKGQTVWGLRHWSKADREVLCGLLACAVFSCSRTSFLPCFSGTWTHLCCSPPHFFRPFCGSHHLPTRTHLRMPEFPREQHLPCAAHHCVKSTCVPLTKNPHHPRRASARSLALQS